MALTPEDVVNKRFQPTKFREGYDQDEVDDFLDEVVVELRRLNQENEELRQRLVASESRISELQRSGGGEQQQAAAAAPSYTEPVAAPEPVAAAPAPAAEVAPAFDETGSTNNLLQLARRLHEEHVREGIEKRDALIAEGQSTAARLISEAEAEHGRKVTELEQQRTALEAQIEELRSFERDYRSNLKSYIEGQLRELESVDAVNSGASTSQASGDFGGGDYGVPANQPPASYQGFVGN
ncbi:DivIVA domain-containing protein [Salinibacterium sp. dk2585]|uniref:DivIVA domain-containing protein n=1 Tax=unclassified Salinibacterium TaxID=2632331 RepID=UPI0011C24D2E|nr:MULTISPECIES: DivIVA domain-containing protein [unclassified Salinibacterium]QEE61125.1 DivIVA domain-containing protein [Salinibacterium sp. dk2585]TXK53068.1 DivIVA domain-containing protein [Salinibacterium sp. dk5596]